jgi:hypothetical protein
LDESCRRCAAFYIAEVHVCMYSLTNCTEEAASSARNATFS